MSDQRLEELLAVDYWSRKETRGDQDWDDIFQQLLSFMSDDLPIDFDRPLLSDVAAERLGNAIGAEASHRYGYAWPKVAEVRARLAPIFEAVTARERRAPGAVEAFSHGCLDLHSFHKLHQVLIVEWLQALQGSGVDTPERLVAEIRLWPWGDSLFRAREALIEYLGNVAQLVRAVAANELGKTLDDLEVEFESEWTIAWPLFEAVKRAEMELPGVAGPFIWGLPYRVREEFRVQQWVFDLVVEREGIEQEVPYFNSLEWIAADEILSQSPTWIAALVAAGRKDLADTVALETKVRGPDVANYLANLTGDPDDQIARAAAANLAIYYGRATADATTRGFVAVFDDATLFRALIVYDHDDLVHPRIVAVHPRHPRRTFNVAEADALVDLIVPPNVRGGEHVESEFRRRASTRRREFSNRVHVTYGMGRGRSPRVTRIEIFGNGIKGADWKPMASLKKSAAEGL